MCVCINYIIYHELGRDTSEEMGGRNGEYTHQFHGVEWIIEIPIIVGPLYWYVKVYVGVWRLC